MIDQKRLHKHILPILLVVAVLFAGSIVAYGATESNRTPHTGLTRALVRPAWSKPAPDDSASSTTAAVSSQTSLAGAHFTQAGRNITFGK